MHVSTLGGYTKPCGLNPETDLEVHHSQAGWANEHGATPMTQQKHLQQGRGWSERVERRGW